MKFEADRQLLEKEIALKISTKIADFTGLSLRRILSPFYQSPFF